jgi:hypothetical protein
MKQNWSSPVALPDFSADCSQQQLFRLRFQNALARGIQRGFHWEEIFDVIWRETQEEYPLGKKDADDLHRELQSWALTLGSRANRPRRVA